VNAIAVCAQNMTKSAENLDVSTALCDEIRYS